MFSKSLQIRTQLGPMGILEHNVMAVTVQSRRDGDHSQCDVNARSEGASHALPPLRLLD